METNQLDETVLALLFASEEPLTARKMSSIIDDVDTDEVKRALKRIETRIAETTPSILLQRVAGGYQLSTNPQYAEYVGRLYSGRRKQRLSRAGMETLAIIAYKQPITRADIETIRGVGCGGVVTTLLERSLIRIVGKARVLGAPFLYGTTREFLEYLGLDSLKDLPSMEEIEELIVKEEAQNAPEPGESSVDPSTFADESDATDAAEDDDTEPAENEEPDEGYALKDANSESDEEPSNAVEDEVEDEMEEDEVDEDSSDRMESVSDGEPPKTKSKTPAASYDTGAWGDEEQTTSFADADEDVKAVEFDGKD